MTHFDFLDDTFCHSFIRLAPPALVPTKTRVFQRILTLTQQTKLANNAENSCQNDALIFLANELQDTS